MDFIGRRKQLVEKTGPQAMIIIPGSVEVLRNGDVHYPFRQNGDFHYFSGFPEPGAILLLTPGHADGNSILFNRESDPLAETWTGPVSYTHLTLPTTPYV